MTLACGSCRQPMEAIDLQTHIGTAVSIDVCWPCHAIWFDNLESTSLSPGSVIELFRRINAKRDVTRTTLSMQPACPLCDRGLALTNDLGRSGRFSYHRCPTGHGRLISFTQFLREKNFVRTLQPSEIARMKLTVKQIRCSSCGGPIDLTRDTACAHCGSAISVLDEAAVQKALASLQEREVARSRIDPERLSEAILQSRRQPPPSSPSSTTWGGHADGGAFADLVEVGISALIAGFFD